MSSGEADSKSVNLGKASAIVLVGNAAGFLVLIVTTPVVSRLYSPTLYGAFATIVAVASIFIGVSTLRLEIIAQGTKDEAESDRLIGNGLVFSLGLSVIFSAGAAVAWIIIDLPLAWVFLGLIVFLSSWHIIGASLLTRRRKYKQLASAGFLNQGGTGILQASFGAIGGGMGGLIAGFCIPRLIWLLPISRQIGSRGFRQLQPRIAVLQRGSAAGGSALINSLAGQLIILLPSFVYGAAYAGLTAMATRLLVSPLSLISRSVTSATIGEVGRILREGDAVSAALKIPRRAAGRL